MDITAIFQPLMLIKITALLIIAGYAVFAFVIYSQIKILNKIIAQASSQLLELIGIVHIVAVISLFLVAVVIL